MSSGGRSRTAALALLLGIVVMSGAAVIVPTAFHWSKTGSIIKEARLKTQRAEKRTEAFETLQKTRQSWRDFSTDKSAGFVSSATDDEGIGETTQRIKALFDQFDGTLNAVNGSAAAGPRDGVGQLDFNGSGTLPRKNLIAFLTAFESKPAFLIISKFETQTRASDRLWISFHASAFRLLESDV